MAEEKKKKTETRYRVLEIEQRYALDDGTILITEERIKDVINRYKNIVNYAYVCHDKCVYTITDAVPSDKVGTVKAKHYHIIIQLANGVTINQCANMFGVPAQQIIIPKGQKGKITERILYFMHEDERSIRAEKTKYSISDIKSNMDISALVEEYKFKLARYGSASIDVKTQIRYDVLYCGLTLSEASSRDEFNYIEDLTKLRQLRLEYISKLDPPSTRLNYYISGGGGAGKGLLSRALARSFFPDLKDDYDIFFEVGAKGSAFEGYDGQPVIIWNDRRSFDLLQELGGRGNLFNVFDTHPTKQRQNIKYGSINLCNKVNIVNSVESYSDFLNGLCGEYADRLGVLHKVEDKKQGYRRFPVIIPLHEEDFDILLNKGFLDNNNNFLEFYEYGNIRGNFQKIRQYLGSQEELARQIEDKTVKPVTDIHQTLIGRADVIDDDVLSMFDGYGVSNSPINERFIKQENIIDLIDK